MTAQASADMNRPYASRIVIFYTTVFAFAALYTPQPLLPMMRAEFGVSESAASLLVSVTLLPLSFAPVVYGFLLQSVSAKRLISVSVAVIMATEAGIFYSASFPFILLMRFVQGLCIPAIITSLMTYVSGMGTAGNMQRLLSLYVASTILGGYFGRLLSGGMATWLGWRYSFLAIFVAMLVNLVLLRALKTDRKVAFTRLRPAAVTGIFFTGGYLRVYSSIFFSFFVFASLLNFLPFRLIEIGGDLSELKISFIYTGYLTGCLAALFSSRIVRVLGSEARVIRSALACYLLSTLLFMIHSTAFAFANMFVFCAAMFLVHAVAPGIVNRHAGDKSGLVNGLYISCYYAGGTLGSWLPGYLYKHFGWNVYILFLAAVIILAFSIAWGIDRSRFELS